MSFSAMFNGGKPCPAGGKKKRAGNAQRARGGAPEGRCHMTIPTLKTCILRVISEVRLFDIIQSNNQCSAIQTRVTSRYYSLNWLLQCKSLMSFSAMFNGGKPCPAGGAKKRAGNAQRARGGAPEGRCHMTIPTLETCILRVVSEVRLFNIIRPSNQCSAI